MLTFFLNAFIVFQKHNAKNASCVLPKGFPLKVLVDIFNKRLNLAAKW